MKKHNQSRSGKEPKAYRIGCCIITILNIVLFAASISLFLTAKSGDEYFNYDEENAKLRKSQVVNESNTFEVLQTPPISIVYLSAKSQNFSNKSLEECIDPVWCSIPMPTVSYFKFPPPTDIDRWRLAQLQASKGEQVLLKRTVKAFPNHFDFIDGDINFRKLHLAMDFFVDEKRDLSPLVKGYVPVGAKAGDEKAEDRRSLAGTSTVITSPKMVNGKLFYPWELEGKRVIPDPYDFRKAKRAPVVQIGYTAYHRDVTYFTGNRIGGAFIDRRLFFKYWRKVRDRIEVPFIAVCAGNENWGMLSTNFPNRTAGWGNCCTKKRDEEVYEFLNHEKTLMLVTNQHTNVSHPKLLVLPRGIPITWGFTRHMIWDAMRNTLKETKKQVLLFAAGSNWGKRPQMIRCVSEKFSVDDFDGHDKKAKGPRFDRMQYYRKLGTAMFGLGLPGLGYDCFRNWELMTMGTILIIERGIGFDRTLWRLPALIVEDFDEVTPQLLRTAYLEALYRADEFEYYRLTQSFWWSVIANVSAAMSTKPLLDTFPMEAEDPKFTRPREPYDCWKTKSCGPGTKRTPKSYC